MKFPPPPKKSRKKQIQKDRNIKTNQKQKSQIRYASAELNEIDKGILSILVEFYMTPNPSILYDLESFRRNS